MDAKTTRIALICADERDTHSYQGMLAGFPDLVTETHVGVDAFRRACVGKLYSGFVVDLRTLISSTTPEKEFFASFPQAFPVLQASPGSDSQRNRLIPAGGKLGNLSGKDILEHFVRTCAENFTPRRVRIDPRRTVYLNVNLQFAMDENAFRTNLLDISRGGCFVICPDSRSEGDSLWLTIKELRGGSPIKATIRWQKAWGGQPDHLPGFGISFDELTPEQSRQIQELIRTRPSTH